MNTNIEEMEINGVKYIRKDLVSEAAKLDAKNAAIVRTQSAGVFFGYVAKTDLGNGGVVVVKNARRLWYWSGAASLSQLAVDGTSKPKDCKFPVAMPEVTITGVLEIIPCTEKAATSINSVELWKA